MSQIPLGFEMHRCFRMKFWTWPHPLRFQLRDWENSVSLTKISQSTWMSRKNQVVAMTTRKRNHRPAEERMAKRHHHCHDSASTRFHRREWKSVEWQTSLHLHEIQIVKS